MRTFTPKQSDIQRAWLVIDAEGKRLGRVATEVAHLLRGKHKPIWAPNVDVGDHVVVINASKLDISLRKSADKLYCRHSGYPGGIKSESSSASWSGTPSGSCSSRCKGMLPKTRLGRAHDQEAPRLRRPDPPAHRPAAAAAPAAVAASSRTPRGTS